MKRSFGTLLHRFSPWLAAIFIASQGLLPSVGHCYSGVLEMAGASSKSSAAEQARSQYGGKILSVEEIDEGSGKAFRVKLLLDSGRIKIVIIEASNG